ncbi:MAG: hypothetical protein DDT23_01339 [candidate division WS2 bacterium]|nr:hypothetical protein [Candidatus Lithacetigena glycinireducens]
MVIIRKVLKVSGFKETGRVLALKALVLTLSLLLLGSLLIGVVSGWQVAGIRGYDVISLKHNSVISLDEAVLIYHNEVTMNRNIWPTSGCIEVQNEMNEHWRRFLHNSKLLEDAGICYAGGFNLPDKGIMFICLAKQVSENQRELILRIMGPFRNVRVVFYEANYPLKQLEEAKDKLTEWHLKTKAVPLSFVDACDVKNKLVVGLDISDLKPEYQKIVRQVVGEDTPIELVRAGPGGLDSKLNRYRPVFGGYK